MPIESGPIEDTEPVLKIEDKDRGIQSNEVTHVTEESPQSEVTELVLKVEDQDSGMASDEVIHMTEESRQFCIDEIDVTVHAQHISPFLESGKEGEALIFLPGWEVSVTDKTTIDMGTEFAENGHTQVYMLTAEGKKMQPKQDNTSAERGEDIEARALAEFIKEKGITQVTLAGYSWGGEKAITLAHVLKDSPQLSVQGLILLSPVGLYDQQPRELTKNLIQDSFISMPKEIASDKNISSNFKKWFHVATDVGKGLMRNTARQGSMVGRIRKDVTAMSEKNPYLEEVDVPVVIVTGEHDSVSDSTKIVTDNKVKNHEREAFLKENLFPQSPFVRMVVAEKMGNHGLAHFRSKQVANATLYLLERYHREQISAQQASKQTNLDI